MASSTLLPITKIETRREALIAIGKVLRDCAVKALAVHYVEVRKIILVMLVRITIRWRSSEAYWYGEEHVQFRREILETRRIVRESVSWIRVGCIPKKNALHLVGIFVRL